MQRGLLLSLSLFCCAAGAGSFTTTRFSQRMPCISVQFARRGFEENLHMKSGNVGPGVIVITQGAVARCCCSSTIVRTFAGTHAGGSSCCCTGTAPRACSFASYSLGGWLVLGMLNVFHLPTTLAGGGSVSLLLFFYNRSHIC